jgi:hypothetical protein
VNRRPLSRLDQNGVESLRRDDLDYERLRALIHAKGHGEPKRLGQSLKFGARSRIAEAARRKGTDRGEAGTQVIPARSGILAEKPCRDEGPQHSMSRGGAQLEETTDVRHGQVLAFLKAGQNGRCAAYRLGSADGFLLRHSVLPFD